MIGTASLSSQGGRTLPGKTDPRTRPEQPLGPRSFPAYTLFEVVLVLALVLILAAITAPSLEGMYADYRVTAAADEVRARWAEARAQAVNEGRPYRFAIVPNGGNIRIAPDGTEFWADGSPPTSRDVLTPPLIVETPLPRGVRVVVGEVLAAGQVPEGETAAAPGQLPPGAYAGVMTFLPDGTATALNGSDTGEIRLTLLGKHATPLILELRTLTGTVTARRVNEVVR